MEALVTIVAVGAYAERQYQKQDGSSEYFKSRGVTMKRGGDVFYGEMTGELASKNRDTQFQQGMPYIVKGFWKHRTWGDSNDRHENFCRRVRQKGLLEGDSQILYSLQHRHAQRNPACCGCQGRGGYAEMG